jgi:hypothetical protein
MHETYADYHDKAISLSNLVGGKRYSGEGGVQTGWADRIG